MAERKLDNVKISVEFKEAQEMGELKTGEGLSALIGKLAKAVKVLIAHLTDNNASGNKHIPAGGSSGQILRWSADGTAVWGADNNTTYSAMTGASASAAGKAGLVPAPAKGNQAKYLRGDGTWQTPPDTNTTYSEASQTAAGLMSVDDKKKLDGVAAGANAYTHPNTSGNKHIPSGGSSGQILRWSADGTAVWGADNNTTYSAMTGASASAAGKAGLVPAPAKGNQAKYLRGDGTWQTPPNTTYSAASDSTAGMMSAADKKKLDSLTELVTVIDDDVTITEIIYNDFIIRLKIVVNNSFTVNSSPKINIKGDIKLLRNEVLCKITGFILSGCQCTYVKTDGGAMLYLLNNETTNQTISPGTYFI